MSNTNPPKSNSAEQAEKERLYSEQLLHMNILISKITTLENDIQHLQTQFSRMKESVNSELPALKSQTEETTLHTKRLDSSIKDLDHYQTKVAKLMKTNVDKLELEAKLRSEVTKRVDGLQTQLQDFSVNEHTGIGDSAGSNEVTPKSFSIKPQGRQTLAAYKESSLQAAEQYLSTIEASVVKMVVQGINDNKQRSVVETKVLQDGERLDQVRRAMEDIIQALKSAQRPRVKVPT